MALLVTKGDVPQGAVKLTPTEARNYQMKQIITWPNYWDVWPFKIGIQTLSTVAALSSLKINNLFRVKLKVPYYGLFPTAIATGLSSFAFIGISHNFFVTENLLIYKEPCPICMESRAVLLQIIGSVVYPCITAPLVNFSVVTRYGTYRLPHYSETTKIMKLLFDMAKSMKKTLLIIAIINTVCASIITAAEGNSLYKIRAKLIEQAKRIAEENVNTASS